MKKMKSAVLFAASVAGLAMSAATFAADSAAYKDAVSAAKSEYQSAVATCNAMKSDERNNCMKDAQAQETIALNKAQELRDSGAKPMDLNAPAGKSTQ